MRSCDQIALFRAPSPAAVEGIDLFCGDVREAIGRAAGARLVIADPPWRYRNEYGVANPEAEAIYACMNDSAIAAILDAAYDTGAARLVVWYTWPKDAEWTAAGGAGPRWGPRISGGAWLKDGGLPGVGFHWRGRTEPVALFTRGVTGRPLEMLHNGYASTPGPHSEKPVEWLRAWVRAWTEPGDLVLDLFAGLAPVARACLAEGRRYVGAEIDRERHAAAMGRLHTYRSSL